MPLVIDASVAVKWMVREGEETDRARTLLGHPEFLIAPDWLLVEAASTFWKKIRGSKLLVIHAERHLEDLPNLFQSLHPARELVELALSWSIRLRHSVYDCLYLALAIREDCKLATFDAGLIETMRCGGLGERVHLL